MYTLYIDTHFVNLVLAIFKDDDIIVKKSLDSNFISKDTIPLIKECLDECNLNVNDISEIIVISGPGSFTGVRIGIVIAKIFGYTLNINIKALSYLEALSLNYDKEVIIGVKDRNGAFIGEFDSNHNLMKDYYYLSNKDLNDNIIFEDNVDLKKVKLFVKNKSGVNPHSLVPLYVKKIEVEEHD